MANRHDNVVNRRQDGPPTQGRRRECERRLRQMARQRARAEERRTVEALAAMTDEELAALAQLDDAQLGYLETQIEAADHLLDTTPRSYAQAVLRALGGST